MMGIPIDQITYETILTDVKYCFLESDKQLILASVNPQIMVESHKHPEVVTFLEQSSHRIPDGIGIVIVSKLTGGKIKERVTGFDLMIKLLEYANQEHKSAFFYGARPEVLTATLENIAKEYPNLSIVGGIDGYTTMTEEQIVKEINQVQPDFLFVALGFPRQELWLQRNRSKLAVKIFQDVGGSFDVISGAVKRAPQFYLDHHLEWLYRSISNPKRIGRIFQLPVFVVKSLWWNIKNKRN